MYGVGLGKYTGNWYFRWRTLFIPSTSKNGLSHRAIARYYFSGNADDYVELNGGFSRGGDFRGESQIIDVTASLQAWANGQANYGWVVIPTGNDGWKSSISGPACISTAISVGATCDATGCSWCATGVDGVAGYSNIASFVSLVAPRM